MLRWMMLTVLFFSLPLFAGVDVRATVAKDTVPINHLVEYTVRVSLSGTDPITSVDLGEMPAFKSSRYGTGSGFSFQNGQASYYYEYKYHLSATREGVFSIPSASVVISGNRYESNSVDLRIVSANAAPSPQLTAFWKRPVPQENTDPSFARFQLSTTNIYVGEGVFAQLGFFRPHRVLSGVSVDEPMLSDFYVESFSRGQQSQVRVDGKIYYLMPIFNKMIYPLSPGEYVLDPARIQYQTSLFDRVRSVVSNGVTLNVKPLPEDGRPDNFRGIVGDFRLSARLLNPQAVYAPNAPITVRLSLEGTGHLKGVTTLDFEPVEEMKIYSSSIEDDGAVSNGGNRRRFDYLVVPKRNGDLEIPSFYLDYFSPTDEQYHRVESLPFKITVFGTVTEDTESEDHNNQSRFLLPDIEGRGRAVVAWHRSPLYVWGVFGAFIFALLPFILLVMKAVFPEMFQLRPERRAYRRLRHDILRLRPTSESLPILRQSVYRFLSVILGESVQGMPIEDLRLRMTDGGFSGVLVDGIAGILIDSETAEYSAEQVDISDLIRRSKGILADLKAFVLSIHSKQGKISV